MAAGAAVVDFVRSVVNLEDIIPSEHNRTEAAPITLARVDDGLPVRRDQLFLAVNTALPCTSTGNSSTSHQICIVSRRCCVMLNLCKAVGIAAAREGRGIN